MRPSGFANGPRRPSSSAVHFDRSCLIQVDRPRELQQGEAGEPDRDPDDALDDDRLSLLASQRGGVRDLRVRSAMQDVTQRTSWRKVTSS